VPAARPVAVIVATPETNVTVLRVVPPFLKVTVPVGVLGPLELTVAVSGTDWP